jgi:putative transposon-encoded protein
MMDIDLDEDEEKASMELIVSDFGNSAPNLAPKMKERK